MQKITSSKTDLKQVPTLFRKYGKMLGPVNLDIGGGSGDTGTSFLWKEFKVKNVVYDPFNRPAHENIENLFIVGRENADTVTICNVLNVIRERLYRLRVMRLAKAMCSQRCDCAGEGHGSIYIQIHEGNRSFNSGETSKGYQLNWPAGCKSYREEITHVFGDRFSRIGNIYIVRR